MVLRQPPITVNQVIEFSLKSYHDVSGLFQTWAAPKELSYMPAAGNCSNVPIPSQLPPSTLLATPVPKPGLELTGSCTIDFGLGEPLTTDIAASKEHPGADAICEHYGLASLISEAPPGAATPVSTANFKYNDLPTPESDHYLWLQDSIQTITYWHSPPQQRSDRRRRLEVTPDEQTRKNYLSEFVQALCTPIPPSVDAADMMKEGRLAYIINEYQMQRVSYWFTIPPTPVRNSMMDRLRGSKTMIWAMYLSANLFKELGENPNGTEVSKCIGWITKLEEKIGSCFYSSSTLQDAADSLLAQLELAFLRFASISVTSGYTVLQRALPKFICLLATNPDLYMEHPNGNLVVSFPRALSSSQYELKRFLMYDTATALVLGIPPLVEYGYDGECDPASHGLEWVHGVPIALAEIIAQVNSWRAGSRVTPLDDWEILERRVLVWEPQLAVSEGENYGTESVARLAVQEGWRHVALIYIYMGMCGVSSHDSRVQASIRQIVELGKIVANLPIGVHMFMHCVVVGLGARYEKHRSMVRDRLLSFKGARVWFFRGPEFSLVLEHLWHGAGAGGAPVIWDDYIQSRRIMLPIRE
ncbi:unnamed protein product [Rhizoctonia solani]|uniref:Fungal zn(2)-cys(6) binuclear cluster domain protein n=1 Tax=Rhizoctonia solani TaxID=456999 RepID=A0A8H3A091_9AGAM|nr:unnamed protein product [Rhizoctonia solani]